MWADELEIVEHLPKQSDFPYSFQSSLSRLIIADVHKKMLHVGANAILAGIRRNFWIIQAKTLIWNHIHNCINCFIYNPRTQAQPLMGDLPEERITPSPPFTCTGVDFTGAFTVKDFQARETLFVCFSTKAVHMELVSSLGTAAVQHQISVQICTSLVLCRRNYV